MFVIRGKNGTRFSSTEIGKVGQEATYKSIEDANIALEQLQETMPFETFEIISIKETR